MPGYSDATSTSLLRSYSEQSQSSDVDEAASSFYPPKPLASHLASREAQFDLDSDGLDDYEYDDPHAGPLLQGLIHTAKARGSVDIRRQPKNGPPQLGDTTEEEGEGHERLNGRVRLDGDELEDLENEQGLPGEGGGWTTKGAGLAAASAVMSNSILGAGIIGLPYAMREGGLVMGIVLLCILGYVTDWSIRLIVLNAKLSGQRTYIEIMDACFGIRGRAAVSFFQFSFAFGGMCAASVIIGDTIPHVLTSFVPFSNVPIVSFFFSRQVVTAFCLLAISYPLSLYRDIEKLSKASALALVSMLIIIISVAIRGPTVDSDLKGDPSQRLSIIAPGVFESIGVISFALVCQHNSLLIYGSLKTPTLDRFAKVTHVSLALSVVACVTMSVTGYIVFTDKTRGNVLNNFPASDWVINIARASFGLNMFTTFPLELFVCREVFETLFYPGQKFSQTRHVVVTTALTLGPLCIALITCDLGVVLEVAGGFSATALAYIFPASCYLQLTRPSAALAHAADAAPTLPSLSANATLKGRTRRMRRKGAWASVVFGFIVMILSTGLALRKAYLAHGTEKTC